MKKEVGIFAQEGLWARKRLLENPERGLRGGEDHSFERKSRHREKMGDL